MGGHGYWYVEITHRQQGFLWKCFLQGDAVLTPQLLGRCIGFSTPVAARWEGLLPSKPHFHPFNHRNGQSIGIWDQEFKLFPQMGGINSCISLGRADMTQYQWRFTPVEGSRPVPRYHGRQTEHTYLSKNLKGKLPDRCPNLLADFYPSDLCGLS